MIYIKKNLKKKKIKTERRGGGGAVISQEPSRQASSRECGSCRGTPSGFCGSGFLRRWHPPARPWHPLLLASTRSTLAALHTPSLGSILWAPVCLPWEPTVRLPGPGPGPQAAPMLFKDFLLAGPGWRGWSRLGRECKASRPLCRWRTQDSAVVSWEALRHPAAVRRNNRPKDASYQDFSCIASASAPASALLCGSGQISPRDLKPCLQVTSGFPFYHMLENYKYYLHLDTGSTLIWKWSLENTDFQNTKHQKISELILNLHLLIWSCAFSHVLYLLSPGLLLGEKIAWIAFSILWS